ncbi:MAG: SDR family oxidoreductase [Mariprofundaceae bacterium]|nr:SDR family oxidoreductase [Mariprofundaceae bacterium]
MSFKDKRIILTGAAGGMGSLLAKALLQRGAKLAMVDANADALQSLASELSGDVYAVSADLSSAVGCAQAVETCQQDLGQVDMLINLAGLNSFSSFAEQDPAHIEMMMRVNVLAPMLLTRALLPSFLANNAGKIVNVGSVFGSIGFAWFTSYSTSKFGLRGFSESLRRELAGTDVQVSYIAPRAVKTPMNDAAVMKMGEATGMNMDEPDVIVEKIIQAIESDKKDSYFGFPESLFVRVNALLPRLVDKALAGQNKIAKTFLSK